ncbi:MAG TPA: alpha-amylase family protein [Acidimicrobiia bacterium]|nr:alpha-amylase family protein [Acidimicrobiia bacterium]
MPENSKQSDIALVERGRYDRWWKNAVLYCLDVETYLDSDGDGVGDFNGLQNRLDYLDDLGIDCVWLMPFYPTTNLDDGYDVKDYYGVDPRLGDMGDFNHLLRAAEHHGIRVISDLVVNHTSKDHPWFQSARHGPDSRYHDYYVWQDEKPEDWETSLVFPGRQIENWTYDQKAKRYYLHHFYSHQPDLNPNNPEVRQEMKEIISFWVGLGLSGFRVDAVPFLIETEGIDAQLEITPHGLLRDLAGGLSRRRGDAIMLGEVNLPPTDAVEFFGDGTEMQMIFNFHVNQYLHLALVRRHADPIRKAISNLPDIPEDCQWANFITNHDELTLDQLTPAEREEVFDAFGPEPDMQLFGRGIRRRLPTMLEGDEQRLRLAYSILFSLPGTPVLFYGEEIGMGENLDIPGRRAVRSPMQWAPERSGGFSSAPPDDLRRPLPTGRYSPKNVNVVSQQNDPDSTLAWMKRLIRRRRSLPEIGLGEYHLIDVGPPEVLAIEYVWADRRLFTLHNLSDRGTEVDLGKAQADGPISSIWSDTRYDDAADTFEMAPNGYRWIRIGADHWFM